MFQTQNLTNDYEEYIRSRSGSVVKDNIMPNTLLYMLTCGRVLRDQSTGLFTFVDVFNQLLMPSNGPLYQNLSIVSCIMYSGTEPVISTTRFVYPNGEESEILTVTGTPNPGIIHIAASFPVKVFTQKGKYYLKVKLQQEELEKDNKFYFEVM